uniref:Uncharacterized protein n=1 Tax=Aplanochytrium stocchinoi TaxID=215587 RepID=A0A7S3LRF5_9STRA|mmetsp:Transcript_15129/g.18703  ORF Transcript_15129/g.18703 Transcript_15129/m.18703 type:complete len:152 (-) Transcript_15129:821-1276(-)
MRLVLQLALRIPVVREIGILIIIPRLGNGSCRENPAVLRASYRLLRTRLQGKGRWTTLGADQGTLSMLGHISTNRKVPVLCLWGEKDTVVPYSESTKILQVAACMRLVVHQDANHDCFANGKLHIRDYFMSNIVSFLEEPLGFDYHILNES